jgi:hypothetical protein
MAEGAEGGYQGGEPGTPLTIDRQSVQPGDQVHIRLVGPPGGIATVELVPIGGAGGFQGPGEGSTER